MNSREPFSQEALNEIFKLSSSVPNRIMSRENSGLEFKESFGWASLPKYLKTCAAFANSKGGYIVYGIADNPHILIGLTGDNRKAFESIEPHRITEFFHSYFDPEIKWRISEHELAGKLFGIIYIEEAQDKPVVCKKSNEKDIKEGDIYYRYHGRSERIKYAELRRILEQKRENEQKIWMQHLAQISKIGARNVAIFDLKNGNVQGLGGSFLIDEPLLSQLSFIKEGEFEEIKGKPTLKLLGNIEPVRGHPPIIGREIVKSKGGLRIDDIVLGFLNLKKVPEPLEYIRQVCFESTAFLPVYYYMSLTGLSRERIISEIEQVVSRERAKKTKLLARISGNGSQYMKFADAGHPSTKKKIEFRDRLKKEKITLPLSDSDMNYCLQSLCGLSIDDVKEHSKYLRELLKGIFNNNYSSATGPTADKLRRAMCWIDEALYKGSGV